MSIWMDGSAGGGTSDGGGGEFPVCLRNCSTTQLTTAASRVCRCTRAESAAIQEALTELSRELADPPKRYQLCCNFQAIIATLWSMAESESALIHRMQTWQI